jgi:hypothetical protein
VSMTLCSHWTPRQYQGTSSAGEVATDMGGLRTVGRSAGSVRWAARGRSGGPRGVLSAAASGLRSCGLDLRCDPGNAGERRRRDGPGPGVHQ